MVSLLCVRVFSCHFILFICMQKMFAVGARCMFLLSVWVLWCLKSGWIPLSYVAISEETSGTSQIKWSQIKWPVRTILLTHFSLQWSCKLWLITRIHNYCTSLMTEDDYSMCSSCFSRVLAGVPCHLHHVHLGLLANRLHPAHDPAEGGESDTEWLTSGCWGIVGCVQM